MNITAVCYTHSHTLLPIEITAPKCTFHHIITTLYGMLTHDSLTGFYRVHQHFSHWKLKLVLNVYNLST